MYSPDLDPVQDSLWLSALVALLPLVTFFVTLGGLRWKAYRAGLASLGVALLVAVLAYGMPVHLAALSATQGLSFGLFPIMWIVVNAVWVYDLTVRSGRFADLRRAIDTVSDDPRVQAVIIAFCFGGLLEALAGFGAPVAITGVMLMAVGFNAMRAAVVVLLANTAPVAFGAIAIPIITAGSLTGIDYHHLGAIVGHQTPFLALFVPMILVFLADGRRGVREVWPLAVVVGATFAVAQYVSATWISVELTDVIASLIGLAAAVALLRVWTPAGAEGARRRLLTELGPESGSGSHVEDGTLTKAVGGRVAELGGSHRAETTASPANQSSADDARGPLTTSRVIMAVLPYLLIIAVFSVAKLVTPLKDALEGTDVSVPWPGLDGNILTATGAVSGSTVYLFSWLSSPGTLLLLSGLAVAAIYRIKPAEMVRAYGENLHKMRFSILTVASVLALAFVMNQSGQTSTIGIWIAGTGAAFPFLSPVLGWLGTAVTGSDTSANALFATLQQSAATEVGVDPALMVAANTSGGVLGKMISPQNLAIAATAVGLAGREGDIFRKVVGWSVGMLVLLCLLVGLQATVLSWMLPS